MVFYKDVDNNKSIIFFSVICLIKDWYTLPLIVQNKAVVTILYILTYPSINKHPLVMKDITGIFNSRST